MAAKKILCQFDVQAVTSLSNPGVGYVGFSAKTDGLYQKIGAASDLRLLTTSDAANYQPVDADLTAIATVGGDVGFLKKTDANTWTLDTSTYALSTHTHAGAYAALAGSLAQSFSVASLYVEAGTYDYTISGLNGVLNFSHYGGAVSFGSGAVTMSAATAYTIAAFDANKTIYSLPLDTYPSLPELSFLKGIAGAINTTYAQIAGSLIQAFNASQLTLEGGVYDWTIAQLSGNLNIAQYQTSYLFSSNGITYSPATINTIAYFDGTKILKSLPTASYPSLTELSYVKGVTGAINTTYAKIAGLSTQAFSTASLTLGNSTGNSPVLTLYGSSPSVYSTIKTTNGNLHIDAYGTASTYLNYYAGTGGVIFGNGATGLSGASVSAAGLITATSVKITTGAGDGKILVSDADGDATWAAPSGTVPAASETSAGIVEIATTAEVLAMSDMLRSLTPYTLANAFTNSSGNNGYISIPIGFGNRMLIQYGSFSANGNGTVSFPIAFPYYCHSVLITAGDGIARIVSKTRFSFVWNDVADAVTSAVPCNWMAIGY